MAENLVASAFPCAISICGFWSFFWWVQPVANAAPFPLLLSTRGDGACSYERQRRSVRPLRLHGRRPQGRDGGDELARYFPGRVRLVSCRPFSYPSERKPARSCDRAGCLLYDDVSAANRVKPGTGFLRWLCRASYPP